MSPLESVQIVVMRIQGKPCSTNAMYIEWKHRHHYSTWWVAVDRLFKAQLVVAHIGKINGTIQFHFAIAYLIVGVLSLKC